MPGHDPVTEAKREPVLSLSMKPDEYAATLSKQSDEALAAEEKAMTERHQREKEFMERRHENEKKVFASKKESLKEKIDAMKQYQEMWQRQEEETQHVPASEVEQLRQRQNDEQLELEHKTGWEVRKPPTGDSTIPGFPPPLVKGHPWIRRSGLDTSHLHPSL
jgi:hypothetical protein